ncbi:glycosyltransferase family protein [Croceimicrobium sp.]|uniref:glycosyltransferase family protein n=1 Tax=Croceimicrobium sp. TaxID=2828340 RepID=UPI003BACA116
MQFLFAAKDGFQYNRTYILAEGLKELGHDVQYYKIPERQPKYGQVLRDLSLKADVVLVPPFRHRDLSFVRRYAQAPVVFDPLISRYLTKVVDYGHYWKAPQKWWIDFRDFRNCDLLLADTAAHLQYFEKTLKLPSSLPKAVVPVGVHLEEFPAHYPKENDTLEVGFYGTFVPLQGVFTIIEAMALLKDEKGLNFTLLGTGHQYEEARHLAIDCGLSLDIFKGWIPYDELAAQIAKFDLALGVFGESLKADLVVPNKLYHYAASGKAILTKDSPGLREVFEPGLDVLTTEADPQALADKIRYLRDHRTELSALGHKARQRMEASYSKAAIAQRLVDAVEKL